MTTAQPQPQSAPPEYYAPRAPSQSQPPIPPRSPQRPQRVRFTSPQPLTLDPETRSLAPSVAPSLAPSYSATGAAPLPAYTQKSRYGPYSSEAEYLAALREWVEEKAFQHPEDNPHALVGFYGKKTTQDYLNKPGGVRSKPRKGSKAGEGGKKGSVSGEGVVGAAGEQDLRRASVPARVEEDLTATRTNGSEGKRSRKGSLRQWLSRDR
jgi:hypothetical protein